MSHCRQQEKRSQRQIYTLICVADILDLTTESQESWQSAALGPVVYLFTTCCATKIPITYY
jgi:hypothetical protein